MAMRGRRRSSDIFFVVRDASMTVESYETASELDHPFRILVVDDNPLVRDALKTLLNFQRGLEVIGVAPDGEVGLALAKELQPDLILLDVRMPKIAGAELLGRVKVDLPSAKVIAISAFQDDASGRAMLDAGADGYFRKTSDPAELLTAIRRMSFVRRSEALDRGEALSPSETQVLRHFAQGYPLRQIAQVMGIEPRTVNALKNQGMQKLGIKSRAELGKVADQQGWA